LGLFLAVVSVVLVQVGCDPKATPASSVVPTVPSVSVSPTISTFATGLTGFPYGIVVDKAGNAYVSEYDNGTIVKITPAGVQTTFATGLQHVRRLAIDASGNIYVADTKNSAVKKLDSLGAVTTLVQNPFGYFRPRGVAVSSNGVVYVTGGYRFPEVWTLAGNKLTPLATGFGTASGVAVDSNTGVVYMCDPNNGVVNKIVGGVVTPFAGGLSKPSGIVVDSHGNVYVTEKSGNRLDMFTPAGVKTVLNSFTTPYGVFTADGKNIYVVSGSTVKKMTYPSNWP
jgi:sugar lactone lactonase YvrE